MPTSAAEHAKHCRERAEDSVRRASEFASPEYRAACLDMAQRWESLATTYDAVVKLNLSLGNTAA